MSRARRNTRGDLGTRALRRRRAGSGPPAVTAGTSIRRSMRSISGPGDPHLVVVAAAAVRQVRACRNSRAHRPWPQRHGFIAATSMEARRIGHAMVGPGDGTETSPFSSGWRSESSTRGVELRQFVEEQHALDARARSRPDLARMPPPVSAAIDWRNDAALRNGRRVRQRLPSRSLAGDRRRSSRPRAIRTATAAAGSRAAAAASIDLPDRRASPIISRLMPAGGRDLDARAWRSPGP